MNIKDVCGNIDRLRDSLVLRHISACGYSLPRKIFSYMLVILINIFNVVKETDIFVCSNSSWNFIRYSYYVNSFRYISHLYAIITPNLSWFYFTKAPFCWLFHRFIIFLNVHLICASWQLKSFDVLWVNFICGKNS